MLIVTWDTDKGEPGAFAFQSRAEMVLALSSDGLELTSPQIIELLDGSGRLDDGDGFAFRRWDDRSADVSVGGFR